MAFFKGIQGVLIIAVLLFAGYLSAMRGIIKRNDLKLISKIVVDIALPAFMIINVTEKFNKKSLLESKIGIFVALATILLTYFISLVISRIIKISDNKRGTFNSIFSFSNTIFMGIPVTLSLFGEEGVPYALLYYIGNTILFWTLGIRGIRSDGGEKGGSFKDTIKKFLSPPLLGFFIAIIIIFMNISLPSFLVQSLKYLGGLSTPLSMLFIGSTIYFSGFKGFGDMKDMTAIFFGRFILAPIITYYFLMFFNVPILLRNVFVVQSAMPAITQSAISAGVYNDNGDYASFMVTVTTILSLITIPLYMIILSK